MARYYDLDSLRVSDINVGTVMFPRIERCILLKDIELAPTADVVEVVRCGQCKHWKINPNNLYGGYCRYCDGASIDHYCSYGERKK